MSQVKSRVGHWKMLWKSVPRGNEGIAQVQVGSADSKPMEVRWRRDPNGLWILFPHGVYGFDISREWDDLGQPVYRVAQRGTSLAWSNLSYFSGDHGAQVVSRTEKVKVTRVRAQMPGKIIRVLVEPGQVIQKDQPVMVMEAMKMENEIRAPLTGRASQIKVIIGQAVESGADLLVLEPEIQFTPA